MFQTRTTVADSWLNWQNLSEFANGIEERIKIEPDVPKEPAPADWRERIPAMFKPYFWHDFSTPHAELWSWENAIELDSSPRPFCAFWPRGRGKSTNAEAVAADLGARGKRTYIMYVSGTQDQADKHVQTIARMLESEGVSKYYPEVGKPRVSKNGNRQWNRSIVTAANDLTIEAVGLNKAVRGQKIDWARPDLIIFDDVDEKHDTPLSTKKKREIITDSILPAGSANCAVLFVQNLIHATSIAVELATEPSTERAAEYLMDRIISGPFPAVEGLEYIQSKVDDLWRWVITKGRSVWEGFTLAICEDELNRVGPHSFLLESQNVVDADSPNALLSAEDFERTRVSVHPDLSRVAVAVDPPGGATECGIVCGGKALIGNDWHGYTLEDASQPAGTRPEQWALEVLKCYYRHGADVIFAESNFGGDMVAATIRQAKWITEDGRVLVDGSKVKVEMVHASRGKLIRAEPIGVIFQQGRCHHVGHFDKLEREWRTWEAGKDSPNRLDAEAWLYTGLKLVDSDADVADLSEIYARLNQ